MSSNSHVHVATGLLGAMLALGCGSSEPTRPNSANPISFERADPNSGVAGSSQRDAAADSPDASTPKTTDDFPGGTAGTKAKSRVVGYLQTWRSLDPSTLDLDTLTHLILAFAAPVTEQAKSAVDFENLNSDVSKLVAAAHQKKVKVLGAIGGGSGGARVTKVLKLDARGVVESTLAFLHRYELDGIDVDIEGDAIDPETFEQLVTGLAAGLLPEGKLLTAAVANYKRDNYRALDKFAFLSVMSYDECGAWGKKRCPHSTYLQAETDLKFWSTEYWKSAGVVYDKANVLLGVPFYGHCWGEGCRALAPVAEPSSTDDPTTWEARNSPSYAQVLALWNKDHASTHEPVPDFLEDDTYYLTLNGPQTIERKAMLAKNYGGIMIWELGHDAPGASSLFSVIQNTR